jgi:hypothetical protein
MFADQICDTLMPLVLLNKILHTMGNITLVHSHGNQFQPNIILVAL